MKKKKNDDEEEEQASQLACTARKLLSLTPALLITRSLAHLDDAQPATRHIIDNRQLLARYKIEYDVLVVIKAYLSKQLLAANIP